MNYETFIYKKHYYANLGCDCDREKCKSNDSGKCTVLICSYFDGKPCPFYKEKVIYAKKY